MDETWTISELAERATRELAVQPAGLDRRVRDLPNERLIRWYTTIGLMDPPLGRRGRVALYGRRHLLQLVAVKRRQAVGWAIAEIQAELAGATDATLAAIARLPAAPAPASAARAAAPTPASAAPAAAPTPASAAPAAAPTPASAAPNAAPADAAPDLERSRDRFWRARPTAPAPPPATAPPGGPVPAHVPAGHVTAGARPAAEAASVAPEPHATPAATGSPAVVAAGLRLAPGATLVLDTLADPGRADLTPAQLAAVAAAARPLLAELRRHGLVPQPNDAPRRHA